MSEMATMLQAGLLNYLAELSRPANAYLDELLEAAKEADFAPIWISPEQGYLIQLLLRLIKAKQVIEVGTQTGYSALMLAEALPADGHLDSFDSDPAACQFARQWITGSPLGERISVHEGDAQSLLQDFPDGQTDAIFIDADKEAYPQYLTQAVRLLRPGGMVLIDNAFAYGQVLEESPAHKTDEVWAIRAFNQLMAKEPSIDASIIPIGDGMWLGIKSDAAS